MDEHIVLKNVNFRGFIMADSLIGLFIISLAIGLFYFNQHNFLKLEHHLYLKNITVRQAYRQNLLSLKDEKQIKHLKVGTGEHSYEISVR